MHVPGAHLFLSLSLPLRITQFLQQKFTSMLLSCVWFYRTSRERSAICYYATACDGALITQLILNNWKQHKMTKGLNFFCCVCDYACWECWTSMFWNEKFNEEFFWWILYNVIIRRIHITPHSLVCLDLIFSCSTSKRPARWTNVNSLNCHLIPCGFICSS